MNRLEKKCFITATAAHGLLFGILIVGPAFFVPSDKENTFKEITVYSPGDITKALTSGGTPEKVQANPLPPPPTTEIKPVESTPKPPDIPKPVVKPEPRDLEPQKPEVKIKLVPHGDEPAPTRKKLKVAELDPSELVSSKPDLNRQKKEAEDARRRQEAADARRRAQEAKAFGNAIRTLKSDMSGSTLVTMPVGVGGGGQASVNYRDLIASKFYAAWNPSFSLSEDTPDVTVSITIKRDGSVTGHIEKKSGNSGMDKSVQYALDAVTFIEPFPPSFKEREMTVPVIFNLHAKRQ